jgi:hypothetical protein
LTPNTAAETRWRKFILRFCSMSAWIRGRTRLLGFESEVVELRRDLVRALANLILRTYKDK